jgi:serine/threonine-protein kinase
MKGQVIGGRFRLERALAIGGMGSVWLAYHLKLDLSVAVKFMDPELADSGSARARFEREARSAAMIKSPHVVQVLDYGVHEDVPYIAMELLEGEDLADKLLREGRLDLPTTAAIVEPVCKALHRAYDAGVVHRDLKPSNVFLARQGDEVVVKLLDFGIAKAVFVPASGEVTRAGALLGSPLYMSPEQVRKSREVDHRSDLWSLGVILYQALTGKMPFDSEELGALLYAICAEPFVPPSTLVPELGAAGDAFFDRALARDPEERFQSARELWAAFSALAEGRTEARVIPAPPFSAPGLGPPTLIPPDVTSPAPPPVAMQLAPTMLARPVDGTFAPSGRSYAPRTERRWSAVLGTLLLGALAASAVFAFVGPRAPAPARPVAPAPAAVVAVPPAPSATPDAGPAAITSAAVTAVATGSASAPTSDGPAEAPVEPPRAPPRKPVVLPRPPRERPTRQLDPAYP